MPLSEAQKSFIEASISHFFDFPQNPHQFKKKQLALQQALIDPCDKDNEFYWVGQCLHNPSNNLRGIEKQGPTLTFGEVETAVLDYIFETLTKTSKKMFNLDKEEILNSLPKNNWNIKFKSSKAYVDGGESIWELPLLPEKIYVQKINLQETLVPIDDEIFASDNETVNESDADLYNEISDSDNDGEFNQHSDSLSESEEDAERMDADENENENESEDEHARIEQQAHVSEEAYEYASEEIDENSRENTSDDDSDDSDDSDEDDEDDEYDIRQEDSQENEGSQENSNDSSNSNPSILVKKAYVKITVTCSPETIIKKTIFVSKMPTDFANDDEEDQYIESVLKKARKLAKHKAVRIAIAECKKHKYIPKDSITRILKSKPAIEIITHRFWYDLLLKNKLKFLEIVELSEEQEKILTHNGIITLYKNKIINFSDAKNLKTHTLLIINHPVYFDLLMREKIKIDHLNEITEERAHFLIHPYLTNLIQRQKITFDKAKRIPIHLKDIIISKHYFTYFANNEINWELFNKINEKHYRIILQNPFANHYHDVTNSLIIFICNNIISLQNLTDLMKQKETSNKEIFLCLMIIAFAKRLYNLCFQTPYAINSITDNTNIILSELEPAAKECNEHIDVFKELVLHALLNYLKRYFINKLSEVENDPFSLKIYKKLIDIIQEDSDDDNKIKGRNVFLELYKFVVKTKNEISRLENPTKLSTFFFGKAKEVSLDKNIRILCDSIISLKPIITTNELRNKKSVSFH